MPKSSSRQNQSIISRFFERAGEIFGRFFGREKKLRRVEKHENEAAWKARRYTTAKPGKFRSNSPTFSRRQVEQQAKLGGVRFETAVRQRVERTRPYKPRGQRTPEQVKESARKASESRAAWRKRTAREPDFDQWVATHTFINAQGQVQSEVFQGRNLAIMQEYRKDWQHALQTGDDAELKRYDRLKILNTVGERVYPATNLNVIRSTLDSMTKAERANFDQNANYLSNYLMAA